MRLIRAFAEELQLGLTELELEGPEAHHLLNVLRVAAGESVQLFNGRGFETDAFVERVSKKAVRFAINEIRSVSRESSHTLIVVSAVPKSDRQQFLVEKLVELGVKAWIPFEFQHSALGVEEKSLEKWRRYVIESCKQCRRNELMQIASLPKKQTIWKETIESLRSVLESSLVEKETREWKRLLLDPRGASISGLRDKLADAPCVIAIGPEGGFSEEELRLASEAGWELVSWGERIMRLETAAIAIAAHLLAP